MSKFDPLVAEGFDVATALEQLAGSEKLYLTVLSKFAASYQNLPDKIQADLEKGDLETVQRDAHTIKGLGGTLGHGALRDVAAKLEHSAAARNADECAQLLPGFRDVFLLVIAGVQKVVNA
ncbi:MAG: Hpt domain-containing protein [Deltaproteobacteria bacterium]|jgi:two-component system sensor histidine kinase/response regulator|nr:Hpt domain-containing protein [Deltaproteobacteria bacterium]